MSEERSREVLNADIGVTCLQVSYMYIQYPNQNPLVLDLFINTFFYNGICGLYEWLEFITFDLPPN